MVHFAWQTFQNLPRHFSPVTSATIPARELAFCNKSSEEGAAKESIASIEASQCFSLALEVLRACSRDPEIVTSDKKKERNWGAVDLKMRGKKAIFSRSSSTEGTTRCLQRERTYTCE